MTLPPPSRSLLDIALDQVEAGGDNAVVFRIDDDGELADLDEEQ